MTELQSKQENIKKNDAVVEAKAKERKQNEGAVRRLGSASIPRLVLEFAIPSIVGMLVNGAYNVIDSIFLGQALGAIGQATMTAANPIMITFMALAMLVGAGGNALCALRFGEGKSEEAQRVLGMTVTLSLILAVAVAALAFIPVTINALLALASATPEVWDASRVFVRIISLGFIFQCIGMGINNFIRTTGAPNRALGTMVVGAVVCVACNFIFVMVLGLGVVGSALATVSGQFVSCICVLWYFILTPGVPLRIHPRFMPLQAKTVRRILSLGVPSFSVQVGGAIVSVILNAMLVKYGSIHPLGPENALASIGVVQRIAMFAIFPLIGTAIAVQPLLGFNYGARLYGRVRKALLCGIALASAIAILMWCGVEAFPEAIVGVFGLRDPELIAFTAFALRVQLALLLFVGFQIVCANYFQATGQPLKSIFLTLTRQILFLVPLYLVLPMVLPAVFPSMTGLDALYFACPLADALAITVTTIFMVFEMKRMKKLELGLIKVEL